MLNPRAKSNLLRVLQPVVFVFCLVALLASILFTLAYAAFGWSIPTIPTYAAIAVGWVLSVLLLFGLFQLRNARRQEMVRRFYLSDTWMYNHEIGYAPLSQIIKDSPYDFAMFAGNALAKMSYGFDIAATPTDFVPNILVASSTFRFHFTEDAEDPEDRGVVIDSWQGNVEKVERTPEGHTSYAPVGTYANATQLAMMLDSLGAFDAYYCDSDSSRTELVS